MERFVVRLLLTGTIFLRRIPFIQKIASALCACTNQLFFDRLAMLYTPARFNCELLLKATFNQRASSEATR